MKCQSTDVGASQGKAYCYKCGIQTAEHVTNLDAVKTWNTRTESTELEQLRKERDKAVELAKRANDGYLHMINLHNNYLSEQITSTDLDEPDYIDHQDVAEIGQAIAKLNQQEIK